MRYKWQFRWGFFVAEFALIPIGCRRRLCYAATHMAQSPALKRGIRFRDLVPFYVVVVLSIRWTAPAAAAGPSIFLVWFAALTCFFIPLAASVMELSRDTPKR